MKALSLILSAYLAVICLVLNIAPQHNDLTLALSYQHSSIINRIAYQFMHQSPIHLCINLYALLSMVFLCRVSITQFGLAMLIAMLVPDIIISDTPMLGISVLNYALCGLMIPFSRNKIRIIIINVIFVAMQSIFPNIAAAAHLYGFIAGIAASYLFLYTKHD